MPGTPGPQTRVGAARHTDRRAARQATPQSLMFEPTVSEYRAHIALHKRRRPAASLGDDDAMPDAAARQAEAPIRELRNAAKRRKVMAEQAMQQAMQQAQPAQQAMQAMQQYSAAVGELARREKELAALKARSAGRRKAHLAVLAHCAVNCAATKTSCCDTQVRKQRSERPVAAAQAVLSDSAVGWDLIIGEDCKTSGVSGTASGDGGGAEACAAITEEPAATSLIDSTVVAVLPMDAVGDEVQWRARTLIAGIQTKRTDAERIRRGAAEAPLVALGADFLRRIRAKTRENLAEQDNFAAAYKEHREAKTERQGGGEASFVRATSMLGRHKSHVQYGVRGVPSGCSIFKSKRYPRLLNLPTTGEVAEAIKAYCKSCAFKFQRLATGMKHEHPGNPDYSWRVGDFFNAFNNRPRQWTDHLGADDEYYLEYVMERGYFGEYVEHLAMQDGIQIDMMRVLELLCDPDAGNIMLSTTNPHRPEPDSAELQMFRRAILHGDPISLEHLDRHNGGSADGDTSHCRPRHVAGQRQFNKLLGESSENLPKEEQRNTCQDCGTTRASYGVPGEGKQQRWCAPCSKQHEGATRNTSTQNMCQDCGTTRASYGVPGEGKQQRWCAPCGKQHEGATRTNTTQNMCEDCGTTRASCGVPGEGKQQRWCAPCSKQHEGATRTNTTQSMCEDCGKTQASYGVPGEAKQRRWCAPCGKQHEGAQRNTKSKKKQKKEKKTRRAPRHCMSIEECLQPP
eukprot:COSAG01_NODE_143_length_24153_cov_54.226116_18_plen_740_part_00